MKTYPIKLDRQRQLRFTSKAIRDLDMELTKDYGRSFSTFLNSMQGGDINFDVLIRALHHGLAHDRSQRLSPDQLCEVIDTHEVLEGDLWVAITDAYMDARGLRRVPADGQENAGVPPASTEPETVLAEA